MHDVMLMMFVFMPSDTYHTLLINESHKKKGFPENPPTKRISQLYRRDNWVTSCETETAPLMMTKPYTNLNGKVYFIF